MWHWLKWNGWIYTALDFKSFHNSSCHWKWISKWSSEPSCTSPQTAETKGKAWSKVEHWYGGQWVYGEKEIEMLLHLWEAKSVWRVRHLLRWRLVWWWWLHGSLSRTQEEVLPAEAPPHTPSPALSLTRRHAWEWWGTAAGRCRLTLTVLVVPQTIISVLYVNWMRRMQCAPCAPCAWQGLGRHPH